MKSKLRRKIEETREEYLKRINKTKEKCIWCGCEIKERALKWKEVCKKCEDANNAVDYSR